MVEILVVIAIIAILAGVALPSITGALKKAKESTAMQTGRGIALGCFQYANDNDQTFPGSQTTPAVVSVTTSTQFFSLIYPTYVSNPDAFYLPMTGKSKLSAGTTTLVAANVSWDATVNSSGNAGLNSTDPDATPLVMSTGSTITYGAAGQTAAATGTIPAATGTPFGTDGIAVALKDGSAFFQGPKGAAGSQLLYLNTTSFTPAATYKQLMP